MKDFYMKRFVHSFISKFFSKVSEMQATISKRTLGMNELIKVLSHQGPSGNTIEIIPRLCKFP